MGELYHMERWQTRQEAVPKPQPNQSEEGITFPPIIDCSFTMRLNIFGFVFQSLSLSLF